MSPSNSVTVLIPRLKAGDAEAAEPLWERYFQQMVNQARNRLGGLRSAAAGPEDVALSAFHCFWDGVRNGRFPRLDDREDLWQVLAMLTANKAVDLIKHEHALMRGGPQGPQDLDDLFSQIVDREPTPQLAVEVAEEGRRLLDLLDNELRQIAIWKMEGYTNAEIAAKRDCAVTTVERKLQLIRALWRESDPRLRVAGHPENVARSQDVAGMESV